MTMFGVCVHFQMLETSYLPSRGAATALRVATRKALLGWTDSWTNTALQKQQSEMHHRLTKYSRVAILT